MKPIDPLNRNDDDRTQTGESEPVELPEESLVESLESPREVEDLVKRRPRASLKGNLRGYWALVALVTYIAGLCSGFLVWGRPAGDPSQSAEQAEHSEMQVLAAQINPKEGYTLPASYGNIGPELITAGAIDLDQFVKIYQEAGRPLSKEQLAILTEGSSEPIVITQENQHFLLNLFWAFGLANQNRILTEGPMMSEGKEGVVRFASTGGWTLAKKPLLEIYASKPIVSLTEAQQKRLEEVAQGVYRPCCDNPTHFPDCNHGMAMLGLLELMASQEASVGEMFQAAKYINAFWFPQQTFEIALAYKTMEGLEFQKVDARQVVGQGMASGSGFQAVHQWLAQNGKLGQAPQGGGSCGVQ